MTSPKSFFGSDRPIAIAHRGGAAGYGKQKYKLENTIQVFREAIKIGFKYLELDVSVTKGRIPVVLHSTTDPFRKRLRKKDEPDAAEIMNYSYEELKIKFNRSIPEVREVFEKIPDAYFLMDPKIDEAVVPLVEVINKAKAQDRILLNTFYPSRLKLLQKLLGKKCHYGLIVDRRPRLINSNLNKLSQKNLEALGIEALVLPYKFLNSKAVQKIHQQNMLLIVWTPNDKASISRSIKLEVDGIISDNIELLKDIILKKNPYNSSILHNHKS